MGCVSRDMAKATVSAARLCRGSMIAVVPQAPGGVLRRGLLLDRALGRPAQLLVGGLVERATRRLGRIAPHDGEDARQLLGPMTAMRWLGQVKTKRGS